MTIQWFPGHMAKARRQVEEKLKQVDLVFELLDARLPLSSRNPMIEDLIREKSRLILLTKSDLADREATRLWAGFFRSDKVRAQPVDILSGTGIKQIGPISRELVKEKLASQTRKGIQRHRIRIMVVGVPNVGKSALINRLAGRSTAKTGDRPGVTRTQQWIKLGNGMELLDTPGILWPKFDDPKVGLRLAASGAIKEEILPVEEIGLYLLNYIAKRYPDLIRDRYRVNPGKEREARLLLEEVGRRRGCMKKGGEIDLEKAAEVVLRDYRSGRLGRISLEFPTDWEEETDEREGNDP
ncbi:ribosome biogenesis GTPase A [Kroppenstedtia guangzhouensis]|jgi:ribosome biogenesis GTPase A|uniref:Ribosome biogenesis GTPase A n=1 Tax=Kroppenstedtia guangzhouensis TaxID=1274356 RepID=A0ABQ1FXS1_9BACL|nr:ribosome biogenesis GTPase YlqF [Kroppenstedtia guangzhouensis]GGA33537.1 ribosome biogenesis GTPase A [Kroppenstedtia guangzhouensis]